MPRPRLSSSGAVRRAAAAIERAGPAVQSLRSLAVAARDLLFPGRCPGCSRRCDSLDFCPDCALRIAPVAPPLCVRCGEPFTSGPDHLCGRCIRRPPHFERARAVALYRGDAADPLTLAIARYKYGFDTALAPLLSGLLCRNFPFTGRHDLVVPVPLHLDRLRWRGFNQAALLARGLARRRGIAFAPAALRRYRATPPQVGLGEAERRRNIRGAFAVHRPAALAGRSILLVDDVYTTGATVDECARTLRRAGARSVDIFVLARAL